MVLSFVLVQCTKDNTNENYNNSKESLTLRSDISIGGEVQSPGCGLDDYVVNTACGNTENVEKILVSPNGCNVKVSMDVKICWNIYATGEKYVVFSNLKWSLAPPYSFDCESWWLSLIMAQPGQQNQLLDEFETYIEQAFEDAYMTDYVTQLQLDCSLETASAFFFKSPCTQRCSTGPSSIDEPFYTYTTPCADDGCCVQVTSYCVLDDGTVWKSGPTVEPISPCTNFHPVTCNKGYYPIGDCIDDGCN